jgi:hypothetical protein
MGGGGAVGGLDERAEHVTGSTYSKMRKTYDREASRAFQDLCRERERETKTRAAAGG